MSDDHDIPLPNKDDVLFRGNFPDWQNNACTNKPSSYSYAEGYKIAAQRLIKHVVETGEDQDFLVYPIIFLYRHHIELLLKSILEQLPYLLDKKLKTNHCSHNLAELWNDLKSLIGEVSEACGWENLSLNAIEGIDCYICQPTHADPKSFTFRYSSNRKGLPHLPEEISHINLRHFGETIEKLATYLDSIDTAIGFACEAKLEMDSEYRDYRLSFYNEFT